MKSKHIVHFLLTVLSFCFMGTVKLNQSLQSSPTPPFAGSHRGCRRFGSCLSDVNHPTELWLSHRFILATEKGAENGLMCCVTVSRVWREQTIVSGAVELRQTGSAGGGVHVTENWSLVAVFDFLFILQRKLVFGSLLSSLNHLAWFEINQQVSASQRARKVPNSSRHGASVAPYKHPHTRDHKHNLVRLCFRFGLMQTLFLWQRCYGNRLDRSGANRWPKTA